MSTASTIPLADRAEIQETIVRFFYLLNQGRAREIPALFTADGRLDLGSGTGKPGVFEGPGIAQAMNQMAAASGWTTRHVITNFVFTPNDDASVSVFAQISYYQTIGPDTKNTIPQGIADLNCKFVRDGGVWKIREHVIKLIFGPLVAMPQGAGR